MVWLVGQTIINGLLAGGVYALVAVGLTVVFGVMKMINFAMGDFLMLGMYMTWICHMTFGMDSYRSIIFVIPMMAIAAFIVFQLFMRPILGKSGETFILVTVGLSFILQNLVQLVFGTAPLTVQSNIKASAFFVGDFSIGFPRFIAFIVAMVLVLILHLVISRTKIGRSMRATAENTDVAQILGINTLVVYTFSFMVGIVMAGISGLLLTPIYYVTSQIGSLFKTNAMMAVVMGGLGDIRGALLAGLSIGLIEALVGSIIAPDLGPAGIFIMFLIVLRLKPNGLFSKQGRLA